MTMLCLIATCILGVLANRYFYHDTKWWLGRACGVTAVPMGLLTLLLMFWAPGAPLFLIACVMVIALGSFGLWLAEGRR